MMESNSSRSHRQARGVENSTEYCITSKAWQCSDYEFGLFNVIENEQGVGVLSEIATKIASSICLLFSVRNIFVIRGKIVGVESQLGSMELPVEDSMTSSR